MKLRLALCIAAFFGVFAPVLAQDDTIAPNTPPLTSSLSGLAPADEYFGRYNLSVLGIANTIKDAGTRIGLGGDVHAMINGPLTYVTDAVRAWEQQYPSDPWIAKDLLALEAVYLRVPTDECFRLAAQTEAWLRSDYPDTVYAAQGRKQLADATPSAATAAPVNAVPTYTTYNTYNTYQSYPQPVVVRQMIPSYATPWDRYVAMRAQFGR